MKNLLLILLLLCGLTPSYAADTLRTHNYESKEESHWYDPIKNLFGQKAPDTKNRDLIVINNDRSITYNGEKLKLMDPIDKWITVIGKPSRIDEYGGYSWDNNGLSISAKKGLVKTIEVQFLDHYEIFPTDKILGKNAGEGGILAKHFKGIIKIEDGYLAREITREEFKKSDVWKKFRKSAFPNSYGMSYGHKEMYQVIMTTFTHDGKTKRVSIY